MSASKVLLGMLATILIAVGVAAQTGTVHLPKQSAAPASVPKHEAAAVHPATSPKSRPAAALAQPAAAPSPAATPAPTPAQATNGGGDDGEGDGGD